MKTSDFNYNLPEELIAQTPVEPRDSSRMMVCNRNNGKREDRIFRDIIDYLHAGDVMVINETRVIPARLLGVKETTGVPTEVLLLRRIELDTWETLVKPGRGSSPGTFAARTCFAASWGMSARIGSSGESRFHSRPASPLRIAFPRFAAFHTIGKRSVPWSRRSSSSGASRRYVPSAKTTVAPA